MKTPKTYRPTGGRAKEFLAYINQAEAELLKRATDGKADMTRQGVPSFADDSAGAYNAGYGSAAPKSYSYASASQASSKGKSGVSGSGSSGKTPGSGNPGGGGGGGGGYNYASAQQAAAKGKSGLSGSGSSNFGLPAGVRQGQSFIPGGYGVQGYSSLKKAAVQAQPSYSSTDVMAALMGLNNKKQFYDRIPPSKKYYDQVGAGDMFSSGPFATANTTLGNDPFADRNRSSFPATMGNIRGVDTIVRGGNRLGIAPYDTSARAAPAAKVQDRLPFTGYNPLSNIYAPMGKQVKSQDRYPYGTSPISAYNPTPAIMKVDPSVLANARNSKIQDRISPTPPGSTGGPIAQDPQIAGRMQAARPVYRLPPGASSYELSGQPKDVLPGPPQGSYFNGLSGYPGSAPPPGAPSTPYNPGGSPYPDTFPVPPWPDDSPRPATPYNPLANIYAPMGGSPPLPDGGENMWWDGMSGGNEYGAAPYNGGPQQQNDPLDNLYDPTGYMGQQPTPLGNDGLYGDKAEDGSLYGGNPTVKPTLATTIQAAIARKLMPVDQAASAIDSWLGKRFGNGTTSLYGGNPMHNKENSGSGTGSNPDGGGSPRNPQDQKEPQTEADRAAYKALSTADQKAVRKLVKQGKTWAEALAAIKGGSGTTPPPATANPPWVPLAFMNPVAPAWNRPWNA